MRVTTDFWVGAYLRRMNASGRTAMLRRRGAAEAGAVFIKVDRVDGTAELYGPAPQASFDTDRPTDRLFVAMLRSGPIPAFEVEERIARELKFDSDLWFIEIESRDGAHDLDLAEI